MSTDPFHDSRRLLRAAATHDDRDRAIASYRAVVNEIGLEQAESSLMRSVDEESANEILNEIMDRE